MDAESVPLTPHETAVGNLRSLSPTETRDLLEAAKRTLPESYRQDGPPLSFHFDEVPDQWLPQNVGVQNRLISSDAKTAKSKRMVIGDYDAEAAEDGTIQDIRKRLPTGKRMFKKTETAGLLHDDSLVSTELKSGIKKQDKTSKIDKELERQMKKRERKLNKEQERLKKERIKELEKREKEKEKLLKVQQREEEKQKQQQERDQKKLERELEKERKAQERRKLQEDKKREKDLQKALAVQRKVAQKEIDKQLDAGPPDDLELELEELLKININQDEDEKEEEVQRPMFPPLELPCAFPDLPEQVVSDVIMIWSFIQSFSDIIGITPCPVHHFIEAVSLGQRSLILSNIHIGLIRLIQADMEESHHLVLTQGSGGTSNFMDRAVVGISGTLDEALAWGFDVDCWRGHLNNFTWPEILRQLAISAGLGPKRLGENKERLLRASDDAEDILMEEGCSYPGLKMPSRLTQGTVKAAAWHVLADVGPEGLTIAEIAARIQKQGLRDLRTSKTPEATVAGALSRDSVFARVAPATYALQMIVSVTHEGSSPGQGMDEDHLMTEEEAPDEDASATEAWIQALTQGDYSSLEFPTRLEVLKTLCNMALDSPTIRACLEARLEREIAEQKKLDVEARAEKRARREQATEETQRRLLEMDNTEGGELTPMQVDAVSENLDSIVKTIMTESLQHSVHSTRSTGGSKWNESLISKAQNHVRFEPVGFDRRFNRYWRLCNEDEIEVSENCVFIEIEGCFKILKTQESLDALLGCLDRRGIREGALYSALQNCRLPDNDHSMTLDQMEDVQYDSGVPGINLFANRVLNKEASINQDWIGRLKEDLGTIEDAVPMELKPQMDVEQWRVQLAEIQSLEEVLSLLGALEQGLAPEVFHSNYHRQPLLLFGAWRQPQGPDPVLGGHLSWLPPSFAAIYLHLCSLDASLRFVQETLAGRETLMSFKYVQKPFVRDLNPHVEATQSQDLDGDGHSNVVSVEPISTGGALLGSVFPVLQKGRPVQKMPVPFTFEIEAIRESVELAERNGTLYANFPVHRGARVSISRQNGGVKSINTLSLKAPSGVEEEEPSNEGVVASSEDQEMPDNVTYYDDGSENSTDGYETSEDDEDYRL